MYVPNFKTEVTVNPDAHWKDVALYKDVGYSYSCVPPAGYPEETEAILELVKIDPRIRPLWLTKAIQRTNGGFEKHVFACIALQDIGAEFHMRLAPIENLDLPSAGIGAAGLKYRRPIFVTSILDGLEQKVMMEGCPQHKAEMAASKLRQNGAIGNFVPLASCVEEARFKVFMLRKKQNEESRNVSQIARDSYKAEKMGEIIAEQALAAELKLHEKDEKFQRKPTIFLSES